MFHLRFLVYFKNWSILSVVEITGLKSVSVLNLLGNILRQDETCKTIVGEILMMENVEGTEKIWWLLLRAS